MASKPVLALLCCAVVLALSFGTATADDATAAAQVQTVVQPAKVHPGLVQPAVLLPAQKRILPISVTLNWPHASIVVGAKFFNYLEQLLEAAKSRDLNVAKTVQQQLFAVTNPTQQAAAQAPKHRRHLSTYASQDVVTGLVSLLPCVLFSCQSEYALAKQKDGSITCKVKIQNDFEIQPHPLLAILGDLNITADLSHNAKPTTKVDTKKKTWKVTKKGPSFSFEKNWKAVLPGTNVTIHEPSDHAVFGGHILKGVTPRE